MQLKLASSALCITMIGVVFAPALAYAADDDPTKATEDEARVHFSAGVNLLRDPARPRYEEAYTEFKKAYALSSSPKILGNIGLCAMKLERDSEAILAYSTYLGLVTDLSADERAQVERDLATLKATLATVSVETKPSGATILDTRVASQGDSITNTYGPITGMTAIGARRGHHIFKARFSDAREVFWEADITGGESHVFELPSAGTPVADPVIVPTPPPPDLIDRSPAPARPIPGIVYIAGGTTIALGAATVIVGIVSLNKKSQFDAQNDGANEARSADLRSTGKTLNVVSDVLLISTIIGAGVTAYLYFTRPRATASAATGTAALSTAIRF